MSTVEKAQDLFEKGLSSLEEGNFNEALHYFNESAKIKPSTEVDDKIKECKEKIKEKKAKEGTAPSSEAPGEAEPKEKSEDDIECEKLIEEKDYYKLLNVTKESVDPDELKKAYKRLAIKFHPDKNKSTRAEEAFKKLSTAYQTLNDPEKRKLYDKYGTDEEFREKYYQANQQRYEEEDEYDIFDILFEGQRGRRPRQRYYQQATPEQQRKMRYLSIFQLLIFLLFFLYQYLPILLAKKPLYSFDQTEDFSIKKRTMRNKVPYFANDKFDQAFSNETMVIEEEANIEKAYVDYSSQSCKEKKDMKSQIELRLWYASKGSSQYYFYIEKLKQMDYSICDVHIKLRTNLEMGLTSDVFAKEAKAEEKEKEEKEEASEDEEKDDNEINDDKDDSTTAEDTKEEDDD